MLIWEVAESLEKMFVGAPAEPLACHRAVAAGTTASAQLHARVLAFIAQPQRDWRCHIVDFVNMNCMWCKREREGWKLRKNLT